MVHRQAVIHRVERTMNIPAQYLHQYSFDVSILDYLINPFCADPRYVGVYKHGGFEKSIDLDTKDPN